MNKTLLIWLILFKHRLFAHRQYNAPDSIQHRNREHIASESLVRKDTEELNRSSTKKLKKIQTFKSLDSNSSPQMDVDDEASQMQRELSYQQTRFLPRPPPPRDVLASPVARNHSRSSKHSVASSDLKGRIYFGDILWTHHKFRHKIRNLKFFLIICIFK